jgi:hypothetical protein
MIGQQPSKGELQPDNQRPLSVEHGNGTVMTTSKDSEQDSHDEIEH